VIEEGAGNKQILWRKEGWMRRRKVTDFEQRVYASLCEVPRGSVTTYGLLAERVGSGSARAVGQALRRNPFAPRVPCHRVIRADMSIGGFQGAESGACVAGKRELLAKEGVLFADGRLKDPSRVFHFGRAAACAAGGTSTLPGAPRGARVRL
jgi:methylated-DNA-[protein]-cysteine S-methyltransferase